MDAEFIALIIITVVNIAGWGFTRVHTYGKLEQKVQQHDKILNDGIVKDLNDLKAQLAGLEATVKIYIDLTKRGER